MTEKVCCYKLRQLMSINSTQPQNSGTCVTRKRKRNINMPSSKRIWDFLKKINYVLCEPSSVRLFYCTGHGTLQRNEFTNQNHFMII